MQPDSPDGTKRAGKAWRAARGRWVAVKLRSPVSTTVGLWAALAVLCAATALVCDAAFAAPARSSAGASATPAVPGANVGTVMDSALPQRILDLPLVDENGHATDLAAFHGKILMISDIMTLCQETCPLDTADLAATARALDADGLAAKVEFLTITIDPARDTPAQLAAYRDLYAPAPSNWQALTGSTSALSALWKYFGVYIQKVAEGTPASTNWRTGAKLTYDLNHSDEVFFIDPAGTERFLLEGMGHVASDTSLPSAMKKYLDAQGQANLNASASDGWSVPQALSVLAWLAKTPIPSASAR